MKWLGAAAILAVALALAACSVDLHHGLDESEANRILVTLDRAGIPASKEKEGGRRPTWKVRVASSDATRAWQVLRQHELPRGPSRGFDVFQKGGLIPSQTEERALYQQALSGEITRMLRAYPGVIDARVLVSLPRRTAFGARKGAARPTASVLLKYLAGRKLSVSDLQRLVAGAVPGLDAQQVAVVATPAKVDDQVTSAMTRLGPFVVSRSSQTGLQIALLAGAGLILLLGALVVLGALRLRRIRVRLRELESSREPPGAADAE